MVGVYNSQQILQTKVTDCESTILTEIQCYSFDSKGSWVLHSSANDSKLIAW